MQIPCMLQKFHKLVNHYQKNDRFYLIDRAKVFEYDENGKAINQIAGNKILHLLKERRTILMGNVEGSLGYDG